MSVLLGKVALTVVVAEIVFRSMFWLLDFGVAHALANGVFVGCAFTAVPLLGAVLLMFIWERLR